MDESHRRAGTARRAAIKAKNGAAGLKVLHLTHPLPDGAGIGFPKLRKLTTSRDLGHHYPQPEAGILVSTNYRHLVSRCTENPVIIRTMRQTGET